MTTALSTRLRDLLPGGPVRVAIAFAPVALVALAAYLQASGFGQLVGAGLSSPSKLLAAAGPATAHAAVTPTTAKTLGSYELFGGSPASSAVPSVSIVALGASDDLYASPVCVGLSLTTLAAFADPRASLATLRLAAPGGGGSLTVGQGEAVLDGRVLFIGVDRVWIERPAASGGVCQAGLFPITAVAPAASAPVRPTAPPTSLVGRVRSSGENEVEIDRAAVDEILERAPTLAQAVRLVPALGPDGSVRGYAVRSIAPGADGALASALGLRAGDTLLSVNGFSVAQPDALLTAYGRLRVAPRIALDVERQGARVTLLVLPR